MTPSNITPIRVRRARPEDDLPANKIRLQWQWERYLEHYDLLDDNGKYRDDVKMPVAWDSDIEGVAFEQGKLTIDDAHKQGRCFEVPLRAIRFEQRTDFVGSQAQFRQTVEYVQRGNEEQTLADLIGLPLDQTSFSLRDNMNAPDGRIWFVHSKHDPLPSADNIKNMRHAFAMVECAPSYGTAVSLLNKEERFQDVSDEIVRFFSRNSLERIQHSSSKVDKKIHESIIVSYLGVLNSLRDLARTSPKSNDSWPIESAKKVFPYLRDAVIFEFPTAAPMVLYQAFNASIGSDPDKMSLGEALPLPEKLPFAATYLAYGDGVPTVGAASSEFRDRKGYILGDLVLANGDVARFYGGYHKDTGESVFYTAFIRANNKWINPQSYAPWIVNTLIDYINDHKTLLEEGRRGALSYRTLVTKVGKKIGWKHPLPPPYYVVELRDQILHDRAEKIRIGLRKIEWQHRWRVRGTWNIRYQRGLLPIDEKVEADLVKRKYAVYTTERPTGELADDLAKRGVLPKQANEWIAILRYWRKDCLKGPENMPLIESVRRSPKAWKQP